MEQDTELRPRYLVRLVIAALCSFWLWMFMPVLSELGLLYSPNTLIPLFVGMAIVQSFRSKVLSLMAALIGSVLYMATYFTSHGLLGLSSIEAFLVQDWLSLVHSIARKTLTEPIQTHVFILLMFSLYWLIVYSSAKRRLWCFYNALAIIVLCVVDANTVVHPNEAIAVNVLIFFVVLGVQRYQELRSSFKVPKHSFVTFMTPLVFVVAVSGAIGLLMPKPSAVLGNPIQWLKHPIYGGQREQLIGFQANNSHLGGSFTMNNDPVMTIVEPYPAYLRGDVFSTYTGQGWEELAAALTAHFSAEVPSGPLTNYSVIPSRQTDQKITILSKHLNSDGVLFGGYALKSIARITNPEKGTNFTVSLATGAIRGPKVEMGDVYHLVSAEPESPYTILRSQLPLPTNPRGTYPEAVLPFLEVPQTLPKRVGNLAKKIAGQADSELAIVNRVQQYLQTNYRYETQGIPVPGKGQDYVDQFLFESKKGYCNNFSSSMAVMLRTLGIPTRWVVGFASGQRDFSYVGDGERYFVRNSDAHSWVEVYFPGVGWVPFDPTPNFSMPFAPQSNQSTSDLTGSQATPGQDLGTVSRYMRKDFQHQAPVPAPERATPVAPSHQGGAHPLVVWSFAVVSVVLIAFYAVMWGYRRRFRYKKLSKVWEGRPEVAVRNAVDVLLHLLSKKGERKRNVTLRDLRDVARHYGIPDDDYRHFVRCSELIWYGAPASDALSTNDVERLQGIWSVWVTNILQEKKRKQNWVDSARSVNADV